MDEPVARMELYFCVEPDEAAALQRLVAAFPELRRLLAQPGGVPAGSLELTSDVAYDVPGTSSQS